MTEAETWRPVPGFEGLYEVSDLGRVRSMARMVRTKDGRSLPVGGRILRLHPNRKGYPNIALYRAGRGYQREVHRLVCRVFHGEPPAGHQAAHEDGVRSNCRADNLSWKTISANSNDRRRHGTMLSGEAAPRAKLTAEQARDICREANAGGSPTAIARRYAVNETAVRKIRDGRLWAEETEAVREILRRPGLTKTMEARRG